MTEHEPRSDRFAVLAVGAEKCAENSGPHRVHVEIHRDLGFDGQGRERSIEPFAESDRTMFTAELPQ